MNKSELKQYCLEHAGEELPAEAQALLAGDPELKKQVDQLITVQKLVSLKRYEKPSDDSLERCIRGVNKEIANNRLSLSAIFREWIAFEPQAVRYASAVAAVLVCAIGISFLATKEKMSVDVAAQQHSDAAMRAVPEPVALTTETDGLDDAFAASNIESNPAYEKPVIVLRVASNQQPRPSGMTIGGGQVMPVSFER